MYREISRAALRLEVGGYAYIEIDRKRWRDSQSMGHQLTRHRDRATWAFKVATFTAVGSSPDDVRTLLRVERTA